jgi:hypothetical protein
VEALESVCDGEGLTVTVSAFAVRIEEKMF